MEQNYNNTQPSSSTITQWPRAFGAYKLSRDAVRKNLSAVILLIVGNIAIVYILSFLLGAILGSKLGVVVSDLVVWVIDAFIIAAQFYVYISGVRGKRVELGEALKVAQPLWWRMFLLQVLVGLTVLGGFILLIVPGIYFALKLSFASYYLVDKNCSVMEAYKASWDATKGNLGKIWGLVGVNILFAILCVVLIGIYFTVMYSAAFAALYEYINEQQPPEPKPVPVPQS
jgi:uncharacterized membrane protein